MYYRAKVRPEEQRANRVRYEQVCEGEYIAFQGPSIYRIFQDEQYWKVLDIAHFGTISSYPAICRTGKSLIQALNYLSLGND